MSPSYSNASSAAEPRPGESGDVSVDTNLVIPPVSAARPIAPRPRSASSVVRVGRYEFAECIAKGGMATVHFARLHGDFDFCRIVAVKRLLPEFASDEQFKAMFVEEARLAARIRHPNVVSTLDVVADRDEVILVMDYVHGDSLSSLCKQLRSRPDPVAPHNVTSAIVSDVLRGLAFAHATTDKAGKPLHIVHCDVSPQNILVGVDGVSRVLDFGIAKATNSLSSADDGMVRGKPGYMAPEQLSGGTATPRSDIFAVGVVLWEMLTGQRLYGGGFKAALSRRQLEAIRPPSTINPGVSPLLDAVVMRALEKEPVRRFRDAAEMMRALELACAPARPSHVAEWVEELAADTLKTRGQLLTQLEHQARRATVPPQPETAVAAFRQELGTESVSTARSLHTQPRRTALSRNTTRVMLAAGVLATALAAGGLLSRGAASDAASRVDLVPGAPRASNAPIVVAPSVGHHPAPAVVTAAAPTAPEFSAVDPSHGLQKPAISGGPLGSAPASKANKSGTTRPPSCSPPYTIDAAGRKHFRAECFR